jgi:hypothetical protein
MTLDVIEFEFPRTPDGWRDWRKEIEAITKDRARSYEDGRGAPLDHQFVIIVGNLLDEIDRLRKLVLVEENVADVFRIDAERYRAERDEARRMYCHAIWLQGGLPPLNVAQDKGWDCFERKA